MKRRELLASAGGLVVAGAIGTLTNNAFAAEHEHKGHEGHTGGAKYAPLIDSALHCVKTAELCLAHCIETLGKGDTTLAKCAVSVQELEAICTSLHKMASMESPFLPDLVKVAARVCIACEEECRKHKQHPSCLACADACAACLKECRKIG